MKNENEARSPVSKSILINRAKTRQFSRDSRTLTRDPFTPNLSTIFPDTNRVSPRTFHARCKASRKWRMDANPGFIAQ